MPRMRADSLRADIAIKAQANEKFRPSERFGALLLIGISFITYRTKQVPKPFRWV